MTEKKAVILVSGGLDSTTCLAIAKAQGYRIHALSFDYGQRHAAELSAVSNVMHAYPEAVFKQIKIDLRTFGGSALTDNIAVPKNRDIDDLIPVTYVPARNTIFLSYALAWAEVLEAFDIFIGVNALDYSGYPDCRPEYITAFEQMANLALASTIHGEQRLVVHTPLLHLSKAQIIKEGLELGVDYSVTLSCYDPTLTGEACGKCDACYLRQKGFAENRLMDPASYLQAA